MCVCAIFIKISPIFPAVGSLPWGPTGPVIVPPPPVHLARSPRAP